MWPWNKLAYLTERTKVLEESLRKAEREARTAKEGLTRVEDLEKALANANQKIDELSERTNPKPWDMLAELEPEKTLQSNLFRFDYRTMWSTFYFRRGDVLAHTSNFLFSTPLGQLNKGKNEAFTISDTNMKEGGRVPSGQPVQVPFITCELIGLPSVTDIIRTDGILRWDLTQTLIEIAPLGAFKWDANGQRGVYELPCALPKKDKKKVGGMLLPGQTSFGVLLDFGSTPLTVKRLSSDARVRITLGAVLPNTIEIG